MVLISCVHGKKEKGKRRGPSCLGVIESYLGIYLTNSASVCRCLHVLGFRLEHGIDNFESSKMYSKEVLEFDET